ncbi:MAG: hypothetical protein C4524_07665 [Candidatus Zixiibacteriota bacterium]|nr:MAG: hypothetical protein C4524_07665 [candidate division Zixibacteria bacterium]
MKMRKALLCLVGFSVALLFAGTASAFHDEGVAYCGGCHTMHNSQNGQLVDPNSPGGNAWLLKDETPSDVCLSCHSQTSATSNRGRDVLSLDPLVPNNECGAGDFVFQLEDNINDGHNGGNPSYWIPGHKSGHSINAPSKGLAVDPVLTTAPGGNFPSSILGCSSCHDPHGNESFRLLNGAHEVQAGAFDFVSPAPNVLGIGVGTGAAESPTNHNAYLDGYSDWCANCHGNYHSSAQLKHPSGEPIGGSIAQIYNLYNGTGDQLGGTQATGYLTAVPFEDPSSTIASTAGPSASSEVSCVTCHRAHSTSSPDAGRWDFAVTLLEEDGHNSGSYAIPNPYAAQTADQRSLCNKCHNKDEHDALNP